MTTNLRGIGWSGLAVVMGAGLAWACASGGNGDTSSSDGGVETLSDSGSEDASSIGDAPSPIDDDSGNPGDDDATVATGDDDDSGTPGDDDSGNPGDDDSGGGEDAGKPPVDAGHDAGHDAGPTADSGCGSVAVVVNEVQTTGVSSGSDEWVELFNPSSCAVDISGWKLKYLSSAGTSPSTIWTAPSSTLLAALGYGVAAGTAYTGSATPIAPTLSNGLAQAGGGVGLYDANGTLLDSVGYGDATNAYIETAVASAPAAGKSIARTPNGADTNDNATNFAIANTPTPGAKN